MPSGLSVLVHTIVRTPPRGSTMKDDDRPRAQPDSLILENPEVVQKDPKSAYLLQAQVGCGMADTREFKVTRPSGMIDAAGRLMKKKEKTVAYLLTLSCIRPLLVVFKALCLLSSRSGLNSLVMDDSLRSFNRSGHYCWHFWGS